METGFAAIGETTNDFWNWYTRDGVSIYDWRTYGVLDNLAYVDGSLSGAVLTITNAPGAWGNGTSDPMYDGYLYPFDDGDIIVTITNLTPGLYNFYIYGHGNEDDQNSTFDVAVDSTDFGSAATTTTSGWNSVVWSEGQQYVVIRGVSVTSPCQTITLTVSPQDSSHAILAGLQIQRVVTNAIIDIDFGAAYDVSPKSGFAATGETTNDFWNWYSRDFEGSERSGGTVAPLQYIDQSVSGAGMTIDNALGAFGNSAADLMYNSYVYPEESGDITVTITNLNVGTYNVYIYGHGNEEDQDSAFDLSVDSTDYGTQTTTSTLDYTSPVWQPGNQFVLFEGVQVTSSGQTMTITVSPNSSTYSILAGIQLVQLK